MLIFSRLCCSYLQTTTSRGQQDKHQTGSPSSHHNCHPSVTRHHMVLETHSGSLDRPSPTKRDHRTSHPIASPITFTTTTSPEPWKRFTVRRSCRAFSELPTRITTTTTTTAVWLLCRREGTEQSIPFNCAAQQKDPPVLGVCGMLQGSC